MSEPFTDMISVLNMPSFYENTAVNVRTVHRCDLCGEYAFLLQKHSDKFTDMISVLNMPAFYEHTAVEPEEFRDMISV